MNKHFKIFLPFLLVGFMAGCDAKNEANNQPQDDEQGQVTPQANTVTITVADKVYDGQAIQASATASSGAQVSLSYKKASEADSAYSADAPKNAGEYTIKAAVAASADYEAGFATKNFTISQKEISLQWNSPADLVYDGQPKVPSLGLIGIIEGDTVNVTTALTAGMSNINVGTFTFEVSLIDNANYKLPQNVVSPEYTIAKANPTYQVPTGLTAIYGEKLADVELPSGFSWQEDANTSVGNVGDNNFHLIYTPSDTVNYVTVRDIPVSITVSKGSPTYTTPTGLTATYGQTLADVVLPTGFAWEDPTTTSVGTAGEHQFMVSFTPTDTANLNVAEHIPVTILVNKANPAYTLPTDLTATYGQHLSDIALPAGFAWADPSQSVGAVGNHQFNVVYTPEDTANYNVVSDLPVSIAVGKANSTVPVLAPIQVVYGKRLSEIELPAELSWPEGQNLNQIPDAGNNYYVVSYQEDENHEVVDNVELLVVVSKAVPTYVLPENITLTFGNRLSDYLLPGGFSWQEDANTLVGDAGHHTFHLVYTPEDIYNYSVVSNIEVEVIVEKADGSINIDASNMSKKWDGQPVSAPSVAYAGEGAPTIYYKLDSSEQEWVTTAPSEVGDYFVYATFEDNNHSLATSSTETFSITKADQNITIDTIGVFKPSDNFSNDDVHYTRLGTGAVTIEYRDINATDDDYSTTVPVVSGTYRVRVSAAADDHYNAGFAVSNMTISDKDVPEVTINKVYTFGEETLIYKKGYFIMTDFTVRANGEVLENSQFGRGIRYRYEGDSDYQYSDSTKMENMPNGHYYIQVFVSISDVSIKDNYTSVYVYGEFDYAKAVPTYTVPTNKTATYGQTFANITDQVVTGCIGYDANGQFFVENDLNETVGNAGEQTIYVTYRRTTSDADHYEVVEHIPLTLTVSKADPDYSWIPSLTVQYNQRYGDVELPEGWSWQSPNNINTAYPNSTFQATFRYAGDDNHIAMNNVTRYIMSVQGYVPYAIEGLDANANQLNIIYSGKPVTFSLTSNVGDGNGADIVVVSPNAGQCSYQYKRDGAPESSYTINAPSTLGLYDVKLTLYPYDKARYQDTVVEFKLNVTNGVVIESFKDTYNDLTYVMYGAVETVTSGLCKIYYHSGNKTAAELADVLPNFECSWYAYNNFQQIEVSKAYSYYNSYTYSNQSSTYYICTLLKQLDGSYNYEYPEDFDGSYDKGIVAYYYGQLYGDIKFTYAINYFTWEDPDTHVVEEQYTISLYPGHMTEYEMNYFFSFDNFIDYSQPEAFAAWEYKSIDDGVVTITYDACLEMIGNGYFGFDTFQINSDHTMTPVLGEPIDTIVVENIVEGQPLYHTCVVYPEIGTSGFKVIAVYEGRYTAEQLEGLIPMSYMPCFFEIDTSLNCPAGFYVCDSQDGIYKTLPIYKNGEFDNILNYKDEDDIYHTFVLVTYYDDDLNDSVFAVYEIAGDRFYSITEFDLTGVPSNVYSWDYDYMNNGYNVIHLTEGYELYFLYDSTTGTYVFSGIL